MWVTWLIRTAIVAVVAYFSAPQLGQIGILGRAENGSVQFLGQWGLMAFLFSVLISIVNAIPLTSKEAKPSSERFFVGEWRYIEEITDPDRGHNKYRREGTLNAKLVDGELKVFSNTNVIEWDSEFVAFSDEVLIIKYKVDRDELDLNNRFNPWEGYLEIRINVARGWWIWRRCVALSGNFYSLGIERKGTITVFRGPDETWLRSKHSHLF